MKRSEILNYIANYLYECNVDPEEADEGAEQILSHIEDSGMLPPINKKAIIAKFGKPVKFETAYNTWEEDEMS